VDKKKGRDTPLWIPWPDALSSFFRAAAARHALVLDDLAIKVVLRLDNAAKEHPAVHAGTGAQALKAAELRLYSVVVILGWVRVVRYSHGVNLLSRLAGLRGVRPPAGPFPLPYTYILIAY
jgi:hypothetical protein